MLECSLCGTKISLVDETKLEGGSFTVSPTGIVVPWDEGLVVNVYNIIKKKNYNTLVDIGAGTGSFSLLTKCHPMQVYSFEPNKSTYDILIRNLEANSVTDMVMVYNMAISNYKGTAKLKIPVDKGISGMSNIGTPKRFDKFMEQDVAVDTLDNVLFDKVKKIDMIKIDTEGCELFVLQGMQKIIARDKPDIVCELNPTNISQFNYDINLINNKMYEYNYKHVRQIGEEDFLFYDS